MMLLCHTSSDSRINPISSQREGYFCLEFNHIMIYVFLFADTSQINIWNNATLFNLETEARNERKLLEKVSFQNSSNSPSNQSITFSSGSGIFTCENMEFENNS